jgi:hypothetical protein
MMPRTRKVVETPEVLIRLVAAGAVAEPPDGEPRDHAPAVRKPLHERRHRYDVAEPEAS